MPPKPKTGVSKKKVVLTNNKPRSPKSNTKPALQVTKKPMSKARKIFVASALSLAALSAAYPYLWKKHLERVIRRSRPSYMYRNSNPGKNNVNSVDPGGRRPVNNYIGPGHLINRPLLPVPINVQRVLLKQVLGKNKFNKLQAVANEHSYQNRYYPKNAGVFIKPSRTPSRNLNNVLGNRMRGWENNM